ncbi:MAG: DNA repair protein RecO [Bacteroidales bacterium]|nr:DNA repair protein RecO [Bacteroidales bacterium]
MIEKSSAIVLRQFKYSDTGIITHLFTEKFGRMAVMVKGAGGRKSEKHRSYLQPLNVVNVTIYNQSAREIQQLKEISLLVSPAGYSVNPVKSAIALFLGEVLYSVLREETPLPDLYEYIFSSINWFGNLEEGIPNFHIAFLAGLCSYLGIEPSGSKPEGDTVFDYLNGTFCSIPPAHGNYEGRHVSAILSLVFSSSWDEIKNIPLTGADRNEALSAILKYYSFHFPSLRKINSIEVLKQVFQ